MIRFYRSLNREPVLLCRKLPRELRQEALLFLMKALGTPWDGRFEFLRSFYVPAWSILYWLLDRPACAGRFGPEALRSIGTAHCLALILHRLDDHLRDGQILLTPIALLVRSQAWMSLVRALETLTGRRTADRELVEGHLTDYYRALSRQDSPRSLKQYGELFGREMGLWMTVPLLIGGRSGGVELTRTIEQAYRAFGLAWRFLDDLEDAAEDLAAGRHTGVYFELPRRMRSTWDGAGAGRGKACASARKAVLAFVSAGGVETRIRARIDGILERAAHDLEPWGLGGLPAELRSLARLWGKGG